MQFSFLYNVFQNGIYGGDSMQVNRLKYFAAVAELGSFSAAAEKLYTTQSAVSKQIMALERELNVTLFDRGHRRAVLTNQGEVVLRYAERILVQCEEMRNELNVIQEQEGGRLSIASIPVMRQYGITELVGRFRRENKDVIMSVGEMEGGEILPAMKNGGYDMAFLRLERLADPGYEVIPLTRDVLTVLLPENHQLAGERVISLIQLKDEPFLLLNEGTLLRGMCVEACQRSGFMPAVAYSGTRNENIAELVAMGMGVSLVMEKFYQHLKPEGVCCIPLKEQFVSTIGLIRVKRKEHSAAAERFWNYVKTVSEKEKHRFI